MDRYTSSKVAALVLATASLSVSTVPAADVAYLTGPEPWISILPDASASITAALDAAFGGGGWDLVDFSEGAAVFDPSRKFIYMEGSMEATANFEAFIEANRVAMQSWVDAGGRLFINAARFGGSDGFDLGFGATMDADLSSSGTATGPHAIFTVDTGTSWTGSYFSHDSISGAGLTSLIVNDNSNAALAELNSGSGGHVLLGSLSAPYFQDSSPEAAQLRVNILRYAAGAEEVPEPSTLAAGLCLGFGLVQVVVRRRRRA